MVKSSAGFIFLLTISLPVTTDLQAQGPPTMSEEKTMRDLFDRWERVWREGQYDLVAHCVQPNYIRHDEAGDRTITREAYAAEIAKTRQERPDIRVVVYDHSLVHGSALHSNGPIRKPAKLA